MVSDFLGLVQVTRCTGRDLSDALKQFLVSVGLRLINLRAVGTDGASNMCGQFNSFFSHLKNDVPHLALFKCVCDSIDKCAGHAFKCIPDELSVLLNGITNYFAHSALRWDEDSQYYKTINGKLPKKLIPLCQTRWLVWLPASEIILEQWHELKGYFAMKADKKAVALKPLFRSKNMLYLVFLKTVLKGINAVSKAFEKTDADITKLYSDLRSQVLVLAGRVLKQHCILEATRPGMLRSDEVQMLKNALNNRENHRPLEDLGVGEAFIKLAQAEKCPHEELLDIRHKCGAYLFTMLKLLLDKFPFNLDAVSKLKFMEKVMTSMNSKGNGWSSQLSRICPAYEGSIDAIDIVEFWSSVLNLKNASGEAPFEQISRFALMCLTLPISNALVERAFCVMSCIKCRRRNKMQVLMIEALMRLRIHLKVRMKTFNFK
ncbi:Protein ZBED8 [Frankliniella fusca]|uniref:Protein ZBED8 n=1 Tax=Frankliniella fusca TaxID=407009 RepID=A0AAE1LDB7_9NEOP|nr:Protein ZBED8 [Frankliniella fusca]